MLNIGLIKYLVATLFTLNAITTSAQTPDSLEIRYDPIYTRKGPASSFIDKLAFTVLETTPASYFGKVDKMRVTRQFFIMHDIETDAVLIFDREGKFRTKIKGSQVPVEIQSKSKKIIKNFEVIENEGVLLIEAHNARNQLFVFQTDGKYLPDKKVDLNFKMSDFFFFSSDRRLFRPSLPMYYRKNLNGPDLFDSVGYEPYSLKYMAASGNTKFSFPIAFRNFPKENEVLGAYYNFNYSGANVFFKRYFDPAFYEIDSSGNIKRTYCLFFPASKSLPAQFINTERNEQYKFIPDVYTSLRSVFMVRDIFFLSFDILGKVATNKSEVFYSTKTDNFVYIGDISPDSLTYGLDLFPGSTVIAADAEQFYIPISSLKMHELRGEAKHKIDNQVLNDYYKQTSRKDNPVILSIKPLEVF